MDSIGLSLEVFIKTRNLRLQDVTVWFEVVPSLLVSNLTRAARHFLILSVNVIIIIVHINRPFFLYDELVEHFSFLLILCKFIGLLELVNLGLILAEPLSRVTLICLLKNISLVGGPLLLLNS